MSSRALSLVVAVVLGAALLAQPPATASDPDARRVTAAEGSWCTAAHWGPARAIPQRYKDVAARTRKVRDADYVVRLVGATHLGVIAMVQGDVDQARRELRGVGQVVKYRRGVRISDLVRKRLHYVLDSAQRQVRGVHGRVGPTVWARGGAVVLPWKGPVPDEVQAVDGVRRNGVEVRVLARPFARYDMDQAAKRLLPYLREHGVESSSVGDCASAAGVVLLVPDPDALPVTQAEVEEAARMPVLVLRGGPIADW